MKSGHGGSLNMAVPPEPAGLDALKAATPGGMVLVPEVVRDARQQADERTKRALQLERRRIGATRELSPGAAVGQ